MCAVCRCFPGKNNKGGDRVPDKQEITNCAHWLQTEIEVLQPQLIILIGKLAIQQFLPVTKLEAVVGKLHTMTINDREVQLAPLPHPSGLSTWFRTEPGKTLLNQSLSAIKAHPAWQMLIKANK
jgi:uracil-DNA glycosylase